MLQGATASTSAPSGCEPRKRAGLHEVPVVLRTAAADSYAQVAENQKRHGLTPLDLARFIRAKVDEGESNATIAKRLGMNLTTVAHHLSLLELPPELNEALKSGRCTSPRTLHDLSKLHKEQPERVRALVAGGAEITRNTVAAMRTAPVPAVEAEPKSSHTTTPLAQANAICARLELALDRLKQAGGEIPDADLADLLRRLAGLASRLGRGV